MKMLYTLLIVCIAGVLLITGGKLIPQLSRQFHPDSFINDLSKYQLFASLIAVLALVCTVIVNPESKQFLRIGQLDAIPVKETWLGINGKASWLVNGFQLLFFISLATGIFMFIVVKYTNSLENFQWNFVPYILLFSLTNSLAEELIFRFAIVGGLTGYSSKIMMLILSAVLFGLPHFFGNPGGIIGVIMSAVLGYILCKAAIETKGLMIPWTIHFVQDVIIFTALMMMNAEHTG